MAINKRIIRSNDEAAAGASFNTVTYTGNGSTQSISTVGFQPDFVWIKDRDGADNHALTDSVRGTNKILFSNLTNSESTDTDNITSFDTNGFSLGNSPRVNSNGEDHVAWCWKGAGAAVSNTDGTITSQVSANQDAGFSIVKYTGDSTQESATAGHGLSEAPQLIFTKNLNGSARDWVVYCSEAPAANVPYGGRLNSTDVFFTAPQFVGNSGVPTSSVLTFQSGTYPFQVIQNGVSYIAYCFHSVDGYQKVGSYTGTGGVNSVSFGFAPRFIIVKRTDSTGSWRMYDSVRDSGTRPLRIDHNLQANASTAEYDSSGSADGYMTFTTDGISFLSGENHPDLNASGGNYIYLAIA